MGDTEQEEYLQEQIKEQQEVNMQEEKLRREYKQLFEIFTQAQKENA